MGLMDRFIKKKTKDQLKKAVATDDKKKEKKEVAAVTESKDAATPAKGGNVAYRVLVKPLVTEKTAVMQSANKYTFIVALWAKKTHVKAAIKEMYGVDPIAVNMVNVQGHRVRFGKSAGKRSDYKKAVITLPAGKSITIHEGV